jgi:hypothetical protein
MPVRTQIKNKKNERNYCEKDEEWKEDRHADDGEAHRQECESAGAGSL